VGESAAEESAKKFMLHFMVQIWSLLLPVWAAVQVRELPASLPVWLRLLARSDHRYCKFAVFL
jgi:hypothetical protein